MTQDQRIAQLLLETGAYKDLQEPVILTSGELGIYYINTEKLAQDKGEWEKYGDNADALIKHACKTAKEKPLFKETIEIIAQKAQEYIDINGSVAIAGGQRRDWLFSGPVAETLNLPHVSLYKDGRIELKKPEEESAPTSSLNNFTILHIVDLIAEGSSIYRKELAQEHGWVPMLRSAGAHISDIVAIVSRKQGGEESLANQRVIVHPFVTIDETFLRQYSTNPQQAAAYFSNPTQWSQSYLKEHGVAALINTFDPNNAKLERAQKFLRRYHTILEQSEQLDSLRHTVQTRYGYSLDRLREGK